MRIIVCGGRDFRDRLWLYAGLDRLHGVNPITHVIEGGAEGADRYAAEWAKQHNIKSTTVQANWGEHGKRAGYLRNVEMADMDPLLVLAAPGGKGTAMMVAIAEQRQIPVAKLAGMDVARSRRGGESANVAADPSQSPPGT